ncbi:hypothetical protein KQX54_013161 [Cotesia glomerata]|uniref:DUF4806 domain-containing protein n=1 Tax=Cotesia glomerata TaxID=32391 RepID=A0AAV7IF88_COTGL|nr:hypothetical protein KQX54_013161 [Cotesia glomerata]
MMSPITQIKTKKDWAVVYFIEAKEYSEVPSNWLLRDDRYEDKIACRWPGLRVKNITQKMKNRIIPPEDWPIHAVEILRYCDTLESARQAAEDSQYSSAPETLGRGCRKKTVTSPVRDALKLSNKKSRIYTSSSDEDSDHGEPEIDKALSSANKILNNVKSNKNKSEVITSGSHGVNESTNAQVNHKLEILDDKLDTCVHLLGKLVIEVRDLKQRSVSNNNGNSGLDTAISTEVESHLKLDTRDKVTAFEVRLESCVEFKNEFIRTIKQVGGANGKDFTERALAFIFSNKFAKDNTWEGKITKYKVNTLKVIEICEKIILEKFPTWDKAEFSKAGTNWFRLGNQRAGEQPKQVTKKKYTGKCW